MSCFIYDSLGDSITYIITIMFETTAFLEEETDAFETDRTLQRYIYSEEVTIAMCSYHSLLYSALLFETSGTRAPPEGKNITLQLQFPTHRHPSTATGCKTLNTAV